MSNLRNAVKARFYPFVEERGFVRSKSDHPHFTAFRRTRGAIVHILEIQWDKYGKPRFVVYFGEVPVAGLDIEGRRMSGNEIPSHHYPTLGMLKRRKGPHGWFQLKRPWLDALASWKWSYDPDEVVDQLIGCYPEVEAWWLEKSEGPHIDFAWRAA